MKSIIACCAALAFAALAFAACAAPTASTTASTTAPTTAAPSSGPDHGACEAARSASGRAATTPDGATLWYDLQGPASAPVVVFLHGGPGYNAASFMSVVGQALSQRLQVLALDQRGCGRSFALGPRSRVGMDATVDDLAWLQDREHLGPLHLIGHSFGGAVAVEFARRYPDRTAKVMLVDTTNDLGAALEHQLATVRARADLFGDQADAVRAIVDEPRSALQRLGGLYGQLGRLAVQRQLHFASDEGQALMEASDARSGIMACTTGRAVQALVEEGWLTRAQAALSLSEKGVLLAGRHSEAIGEAQIASAAAAFDVSVVWFEASGHFVFVEEPERFVSVVEDIVLGDLASFSD